MKSLALLSVVLFSSMNLLLAGCEATMFGMSKSQFRSLTPDQQQQVIDNYHQRQIEASRAAQERELVRTQNEALISLIGVAGEAVKRLDQPDRPQPRRYPFPRFPD